MRRALTLLEIAAELAGEGGEVTAGTLEQVLADRTRRFDKGGEQFYDQISALHKSVRSSNPDAALYWLARMLDGGADPAYLARRLTRMAVEDIGLADPRALQYLIETCGVERVMLGTDYPFPLGEQVPGAGIEEIPLGDVERARLYHGTALEWLGLPPSRFL